MAMAVALSVIVWRMLRDERQRSEARVVALATRRRGRTSRPSPSESGAARMSDASDPADTAARRASTPLFAEREDRRFRSRWASPVRGRWLRRSWPSVRESWILVGVIGRWARRRSRWRCVDGRAPRAAPTAERRQPAAAAAGPGLELLSLRDTRQPGSLTITGLVQNPRDGASLSRVTVTAYTFDDKGAFLASGRAPIDVSRARARRRIAVRRDRAGHRYRRALSHRVPRRGRTRHRARRQAAAGSRRRPRLAPAAELVMPGWNAP